uniref:Sulfatase-modifying factor enzyme-like domain-containing protein n=1 Tax=Streptomyces sp. WT6 TaxID=1486372 RepID=A0A023PZQ6_9ACTN|nr:hypothetical protein wt6.34c [Streptomyces sp. WT6]
MDLSSCTPREPLRCLISQSPTPCQQGLADRTEASIRDRPLRVPPPSSPSGCCYPVPPSPLALVLAAPQGIIMKALRSAAVAAIGLVLLASGTTPSTAESPLSSGRVRELEASLSRLEDSLVWRGSITATFPHVDTAVQRALESFRRVQGAHPSAVPQARTFIKQLDRLAAEAGYWVRESARAGFKPDPFLATDPLMRATVAEWATEVSEVRHALLTRPTNRRPRAATLAAASANASSPPGTTFSDAQEHQAMKMVVIPRGSYTAGATAREQQLWQVPEGRRGFERPQRRVRVGRAIAVGQTEVTLGQFKRFVRETGYSPAQGMRTWAPGQDGWMDFRPELNYLHPGFAQSDLHPVVGITKSDAQAFAAWMSRRTGYTYRLPTEGEWEYVARAGTVSTFFWGERIEAAGEYANTYDEDAFAANRFRAGTKTWEQVAGVHDGYAFTAPVASFKPNRFGLYDVTGNAREFVADTWVEDLKNASADASVRRGEAPFVVVRGGAWNYRPLNLRIAYRSGYLCSEARTNMFGFRLVRDL